MGMEPLKENDPKQLGQWRINGRLGEGGFGTVFLAQKGAQKAAIKVIRNEFVQEDDARNRLSVEAEILSKLLDPAIGKILDSDLSETFPWIATEFINGPTLDEKVKYEGPLDEIAWFNLAANIFHAIVSANELGIIHKDIKPSNIILGETGNKLIDFGIAHIQGQTRTAIFGDLEGSTPFSSPEHFTPSANPKMDVFSAASTLAFAAKGAAIWNGDSDLQLMRSINEDSPNLEGLSENQKTFLNPLFEKNPSDRPSPLEAHESALGYIEFLLGKRKKPTPLKGRSTFKKLTHSKKAISSIAVALIVGAGFTASLAGFSLSPTEVRSLLVKDRISLTSDQQKQLSACEDFAGVGDHKAAIEACRELADLGEALAQYSLGISLKKPEEVEFWVRKAADQKLPKALAYLAYLEIDKKNYSEALVLGKQAADSGSIDGVNVVGISYGYLKQYDLAVEWYKKSWELGDVLGAMNLGFHYRFDDVDKIEAAKWLKIAAETESAVFEGDNEFAYADFLRIDMKNNVEACQWYKKSADARYQEDDKNGVEAFKKYCKNDVQVTNSAASPSPKTPLASPSPKTPLASSSLKKPVPATVDSKDAAPSPADSKNPITSSDSFKVSAPLADNLQVREIFGRTYMGSGLYWVIPLTNSKDERVPALTGIQFRLIGYPDAGWVGVPYKLKTDLKFGTVRAEVDDLLFAVVFKDFKYCPEFRVIREENSKITQIWGKGQPECANDYNPA